MKNTEDKVSGQDVVRVDHHLCDRKDCSAILRDAIAYIYAPIAVWTEDFMVAGSCDGDGTRQYHLMVTRLGFLVILAMLSHKQPFM